MADNWKEQHVSKIYEFRPQLPLNIEKTEKKTGGSNEFLALKISLNEIADFFKDMKIFNLFSASRTDPRLRNPDIKASVLPEIWENLEKWVAAMNFSS